MKTLFITTSLPHLKSTGGEVATSNFISAIKASGHDVTVLGYLRTGDPAPESDSEYKIVREWPIETQTAKWRTRIWLIRSLFSKHPFTVEKFKTASMRKAIQRHLKQGVYDQIVIDHSQMGWVLNIPKLPKKRVFIAHNFENGLYKEVAQRSKGIRSFIYARESRLIAKVEKRLVLETQQTWTVTATEAGQFNALSGTDLAINFDLPGIDLSLDPKTNAPAEQRDIGILGAWTWEVNRVGIEWFLRDVVPLLDKNVRIGIAGRGTETLSTPPRNVTFHGFVNDAGKFLRSSRVVALPTIAGAGVQLKTIASIASGATVVGTPLSLRGIENIPENTFIAAQEPVDFAKVLTDALSLQRSETAAAQGLAWFKERKTRFESGVKASLSNIRI